MATPDEPFDLFTSLRYDPALAKVPSTDLKHAGWNFDNASPWYMLGFHRDRMLRAATHWKWDLAVAAISGEEGLARLDRAMSAAVATKGEGHRPLRVKVVLHKAGQMDYEISAVPETPLVNLFPLRLPPATPGDGINRGADAKKDVVYTVTLDTAVTCRSEYTHFKTTRRQMYDDARQRAGIQLGEKMEVLIIQKEVGTVMEGSTTTPYFWRGNRWVTPPVAHKYSVDDGSGGQDGTSRRWALET
jgi:4-amino-4-deoxychorismate lyase